MKSKIKGVRFDSDTGKILYDTEDGAEEVDSGYDDATKIGRSPVTTNIAGALSGILEPVSGGEEYYKDKAPEANMAGRIAGIPNIAGALKSLILGGGRLAKNSTDAIRAAQKNFSKNKGAISPKEAQEGWKAMREGDEVIKYQTNRLGEVIKDLKPINSKKITDTVGYDTAKKLETLGVTSKKELSNDVVRKLHEMVKGVGFDDLNNPRLINAVKQIVGE